MKGYVRPHWDDYFLEICEAVSKRATCDRGRSGCLITRNNQILVSGYVGSPPSLPHCDDVGHLIRSVINDDGTQSEHCVRTIHAEQNAICQAAKYGISLENSTLYCRMTPCNTCAMLIISSGIKRVVCQRKYQRSKSSEDLFRHANIEVHYDSEECQTYPSS